MIQPIIGRQFPDKVIPLIDNAKRSIKIVVFDWRWYPNDPASSVQLFNQAFVRAVRRGVDVSAIINASDIIAILNSFGCHVKNLISKNIVHAKMIIVDDEFLVIGSHNFTQPAFTMNREISLLCDNVDDMSPYNKFFETLWLL
jgi:phosphatidylserine/phosphatidylglycerophosphate/cardiolipin synthase-like enzyme